MLHISYSLFVYFQELQQVAELQLSLQNTVSVCVNGRRYVRTIMHIDYTIYVILHIVSGNIKHVLYFPYSFVLVIQEQLCT